MRVKRMPSGSLQTPPRSLRLNRSGILSGSLAAALGLSGETRTSHQS
jgi:hypothetical protein